jgi:hypothetical protein
MLQVIYMIPRMWLRVSMNMPRYLHSRMLSIIYVFSDRTVMFSSVWSIIYDFSRICYIMYVFTVIWLIICVSMDATNYLYLSIEMTGYSCIFIDLTPYLRVSMDFSRYLYIFVDKTQCVLVSMDVTCYLCFHGCDLLLMFSWMWPVTYVFMGVTSFVSVDDTLCFHGYVYSWNAIFMCLHWDDSLLAYLNLTWYKRVSIDMARYLYASTYINRYVCISRMWLVICFPLIWHLVFSKGVTSYSLV